MSKCKSCGAEVVWVEMESGKKMPIDADSVRKAVVINATWTKGAVRDVAVSHFETCPNAEGHRK